MREVVEEHELYSELQMYKLKLLRKIGGLT